MQLQTRDYQETRRIDALAAILQDETIGTDGLDAAYLAAGELCDHLRDATTATDEWDVRMAYSRLWDDAISLLARTRDLRR